MKSRKRIKQALIAQDYRIGLAEALDDKPLAEYWKGVKNTLTWVLE